MYAVDLPGHGYSDIPEGPYDADFFVRYHFASWTGTAPIDAWLQFAIPRDPALLERVLSRGVIPNHPWQEPAIFVDDSLATASHLASS